MDALFSRGPFSPHRGRLRIQHPSQRGVETCIILSVNKIKEKHAGYLPANPVPIEDEIFSDLGLHSPGLPDGSNEAAFLSAVPNKNLI